MLSFNICHPTQPKHHSFLFMSCCFITVKILREHCELHCSAALYFQHAATSQSGNSLSSTLVMKVIQALRTMYLPSLLWHLPFCSSSCWVRTQAWSWRTEKKQAPCTQHQNRGQYYSRMKTLLLQTLFGEREASVKVHIC